MEYAIALGITALFAVIYLILRPKSRERFSVSIGDDFAEFCYAQAKAFGIADKSCNKEFCVKKDVRLILSTAKRLKRLRHDKCDFDFDGFLTAVDHCNAKLKEINKADMSVLCDLAVKDNETRIEKILRIALDKDEYLLEQKTVESAYAVFNKVSTVTFKEIVNSQLMLDYLLVEKLSYLAKRIKTILQIRRIAYAFTTASYALKNTAIYKRLADNNVFLHFASLRLFEKCEGASAVYFDVENSINRLSRSIEQCFEKEFDFYACYAPLDLLRCFDVITKSSYEDLKGYFEELGKQSDKINQDEYAYALVVRGYLLRTNPPKIAAIAYDFLGKKRYVISMKYGFLSLATALTSCQMMSLLFGTKKNKRQKSGAVILDKADFYEDCSISLGINLSNDVLRLTPSLPCSVGEVTFDFIHGGITHNITIKRGNSFSLVVNGTSLYGITYLKLGEQSLNIVMTIARDGTNVR